MKKLILCVIVVFAIFSFTSCTDLYDDEEFEQQIRQIDPDDDGTIDPDPQETGEEGS